MHERKAHIEYTPNISKLTQKKRVCAYARVSSEKDEAFHSLSAQISYYRNKIAEHPDWEFVEVFSDRGITGTKENREGFQRMLTACREGKIDIVLAKSITRFARNTLILLETVRELRSLGVDIHFEEEHIETLSEKGEFMIAILAARAQEESRQASENQKWRIQKSYEKGIPVTGNCLGYRLDNHQFLIEDEEEPIVLRIFSMYLSGMGKAAIARQLTKDGIKPQRSKEYWNPNTIAFIIRNEKYAGNLLLGKQYRTDFITKKTARNRGERPLYFVENAHSPIIKEETYNSVKEEINKRAMANHPDERIKPKYPFTGIITCGKCGKRYIRRKSTNEKQYSQPGWQCTTAHCYGKEFCDAQRIPERILTEYTCKALKLDSLDGIDLCDYLQKIVVPGTNKLLYVFADGSERLVEWVYHSRRESWTPEMKAKAREQTKKRWEERKKNAKSTD